MPDIKKILIADNQAIFREALRMLLSSNPAYEVVGEAENGLEAIRFVDPESLLLS